MYVLHLVNLILWTIIGIHALVYGQVDTIKFACLWITFISSQIALMITFHNAIPDGKPHSLTNSDDPQIRRLIKLNCRLYYQKKIVYWVQLASRNDLPMILAIFHHLQQIAFKRWDYRELNLYNELIAEEKEFDDE